jgi:hypothetical protein
MKYYDKYKNLYEGRIPVEYVAGSKAQPNWLVLERIEAPKPEDLPPPTPGKFLVPETATKKREPMVFHVLEVGSNCGEIKVGDLISITYLAGDAYAGSSIVVCHIDDVCFRWGEGLLL